MDFFTQNQLFVLYVLNLSLIAYIRYTNFGFIKKNLIAVLNYTTAQQIQKSEINKKSITNFFLTLNFYISVTIFGIYALSKFKLIPENSNHFLIAFGIFIGVLLMIYLNAAVNYLSAQIFYLKETAADFNRNNKIAYRAFGIILVGINILISFSSIENIAFYSGIILIGIFYLLRIFRFIRINLSKQMNIFYLFLYLCAVEIFPILYIVKIFTLFHTATN